MSTNVHNFCKTSAKYIIQPVLSPVSSPAVQMQATQSFQSRCRAQEKENHREAKLSPRWPLESSHCKTTDLPDQTILSPVPLLCNHPFLQEGPNRPIYTKCRINDMKSTQCPGRSYINRISLVMLVFITVLSFVGSALSCSYLRHVIDRCNDLEAKLSKVQSDNQQGLNDAGEFCLPCSHLIQGPFEEDNVVLKNLTWRTVGGVTVCCGRTSSQFLIIFELYVQQKQKEKCAQEIHNVSCANCTNISNSTDRPRGKPVSAHLEAGLQEKSVIGKLFQPIRNWKDDQVTTHISGLVLQNDKILVAESGFYFVYSQVGFEINYNSANDAESSNPTLYHYLNRYNPIYPNGGNQTIVKGAATQCWEKKKDFGFYTSYASATLFLNQGDQLYIMVSQLHISRDPKLTYMGVYKIY